MKNFRYIFLLSIFTCFSINYSCSNDEYSFEYKVEPKTEVGTKLASGTDLFGQIFSDSSYTVTSGVTATEIKYLSQTGLAMKVFVFEVDLTNQNISIEASMPKGGTSFGMQQMTKQATYVDKDGHKVWAGVNADFYNMTTGVPQGIVYRNGTAVKTTFQDAVCTYFAITKDGKAIVAGQDVFEDIKDDIQEAVGGRVWLVQDGAIVKQTDATVEPRTCIGVSKDGTKVYIMAIDGRNFWYSNGMAYGEMGQCLKALGTENGINLDGGGSTTFFIRNTPDFADDRFEIRNWPTDNGGKERAVANGLLIISK
ncbi:exopolysaccharide biosynthesis protein [Dysgonomonas hofstadii]|uniref:Exopolysaccharide biosynthesis protein n=1 Tax=Dysgonomonas hofstadii TaxID=637886 RepID=A0A840CM19_9BACT|nr:phosphodiester glycosidase family protein [Dysgonomonas hofstadii]MBB4037040.1 exopolysaccharide biosynthesis protein [Dysgonomonas hofstadii]